MSGSARHPAVWSPPADRAAVEATARRLIAAGVTVAPDRPLGPLTTFGIGGPAGLFVEPATEAELRAVLGALADTAPTEVPLLVLGRGSNVLVGDGGFPGVVLRLGKGFADLRRHGLAVVAGAAVAMPRLAAWTARHALAGLEFAAAIPASVGGSVAMNAGAHGAEVADRLVDVRLEVPGDAAARWVPATELGLSYRSSLLPDRAVVVAARFRLGPDDPEAISRRLAEHRAWRHRTQPLRARSCGSVFTNPDGASAGRLIEAAGLKGRRVGGAMVSTKHGNFIVVEPGTRARDVLALIGVVQEAVRAAGGPLLSPEVRAVGRFEEQEGG